MMIWKGGEKGVREKKKFFGIVFAVYMPEYAAVFDE